MPTFYDLVPLLSLFQERVQELGLRQRGRRPLRQPSPQALLGQRRRAL